VISRNAKRQKCSLFFRYSLDSTTWTCCGFVQRKLVNVGYKKFCNILTRQDVAKLYSLYNTFAQYIVFYNKSTTDGRKWNMDIKASRFVVGRRRRRRHKRAVTTTCLPSTVSRLYVYVYSKQRQSPRQGRTECVAVPHWMTAEWRQQRLDVIRPEMIGWQKLALITTHPDAQSLSHTTASRTISNKHFGTKSNQIKSNPSLLRYCSQ